MNTLERWVLQNCKFASSDPDVCPECGERTESRCRCKIGDRQCANRHHWAVCKIHGKVATYQPPDNSHAIPVCSCYEPMREYTRKRIAQAAAQTAIPPIPSGMVRLTHFTSENQARQILGSDFGISTLLASTTDSFSNQNEVLSLIQSGSYSAYERGGFGDSVVLLDMPSNLHRSYNYAFRQTVPNAFVLGYVRRSDMQFFPNPNYNPTTAKLPELPRPNTPLRQPAAPQPIPAPQPAGDTNTDIW